MPGSDLVVVGDLTTQRFQGVPPVEPRLQQTIIPLLLNTQTFVSLLPFGSFVSDQPCTFLCHRRYSPFRPAAPVRLHTSLTGLPQTGQVGISPISNIFPRSFHIHGINKPAISGQNPDSELTAPIKRRYSAVFRRQPRSRVQDARGFFFMLIVFVLGSVLVSSVFLSWLWFFLLFCCCLFSCFFLYGLSSIFFRFGFSFLNFSFSVFVFPYHCFRTKSAFALTCKHGRVDIGTMPIMSRMILVRGGKSGTRIRYRLGSLFAQFGPYGSGCAGSILAYRFGVGLSRYRRSCPGSDIGWWFVFQAL